MPPQPGQGPGARATVAVVGGGLAGLHAARLLHRAGVGFQLLEARDRLGGRILSVGVDGREAADGFDLGPSWIWPDMQPALAGLVGELGLPSFAQHSMGDVLLDRDPQGQPRRYPGMRQDPASMRLAGGMGALVRALARDLPRPSLRLGTRIAALELGDAGVTLRVVRSDGGEEALTADQVIVAVPPRLLEATVAFTPALAPEVVRRWRDAATWMAPHAKFLALYDRPFWRDAGLSGTVQSTAGPLAEIHDATTASGAAALFGFLGLAADRRDVLGVTALTRACLDQLARLFGPEAGRPSGTLLKDWAADGWTATGDDRRPAGHPLPTARSWITGQWRDCLALAGSEVSEIAPGYLAGAVDAAERAVSEVMARLVVPAERG
ncbi:FAD-dependent oxidoreductase [Pararoseomonas sp. SCSIO 73927]|uniref:flavin monoamine oxidase family protein n=1 Tax=Pararoseomonas sp. SCSIO 73927 TaxID=3114537 RepID=UPI0030D4146E